MEIMSEILEIHRDIIDTVIDARYIIILPTKVHLVKAMGEGNGNLLQYSCLENPWDREA